jgi:hypothetical protein
MITTLLIGFGILTVINLVLKVHIKDYTIKIPNPVDLIVGVYKLLGFIAFFVIGLGAFALSYSLPVFFLLLITKIILLRL